MPFTARRLVLERYLTTYVEAGAKLRWLKGERRDAEGTLDRYLALQGRDPGMEGYEAARSRFGPAVANAQDQWVAGDLTDKQRDRILRISAAVNAQRDGFDAARAAWKAVLLAMGRMGGDFYTRLNLSGEDRVREAINRADRRFRQAMHDRQNREVWEDSKWRQTHWE